MSFGTWMAIGVVFLVTFAVSDWLTDKTIKLIKKCIAKRREKNSVGFVRYEGQFGKGQTLTKLEEILPVEELIKKD